MGLIKLNLDSLNKNAQEQSCVSLSIFNSPHTSTVQLYRTGEGICRLVSEKELEKFHNSIIWGEKGKSPKQCPRDPRGSF